MKDLIKKILKEETKNEYILEIPNLRFIPDADLSNSEGRTKTWNELLSLLNNKPFIFGYNLNLYYTNITSLGNLQSVNGYLDLFKCHQLTSLGNLQSVKGYLDLNSCEELTSLGNLQSVGDFLDFRGTPLSKKYSEEEIRRMVNVEGRIILK